jgi:hypothetical protein
MSRRDAFADRQDALILSFAQNTEQATYLSLQAALYLRELEPLLANHPSKNSPEMQDLVGELLDLERLPEILDSRQYTPDEIEQLVYSEAALEALRKIHRVERNILEQLSSKGYAAIFEQARGAIERLRSGQ